MVKKTKEQQVRKQPEHASKNVGGKFGLLLAVALFIMGIYFSAAGLFYSTSKAIEEAVLSGQRVTIEVKNLTEQAEAVTETYLAENKETGKDSEQPAEIENITEYSDFLKDIGETDESAKHEEALEYPVPEVKAEQQMELLPPPPLEVQEINGQNVQNQTQRDEKQDGPVLVVIVKGLGISKATTDKALELPKNITLGFSPYSSSLKDWEKRVNGSGHEMLLNLPLETDDYVTDDPGPYALLKNAPADDNQLRIDMLTSLTANKVAMYSDDREAFSKSDVNLLQLLQTLKAENISFVYGGSNAESVISISDELDLPAVTSDIVIDTAISVSEIRKKLDEAVSLAKQNGHAVAVANPYPISLKVIEEWSKELDKQNVRLIPVSELLLKVNQNEG